ncbi:MAG: polyprenyl synthetase family protein, partial [Proteobacteria bacterium]|nr:polyprenyl synthetase family protein [Pseudomonadota bacterium]
MSADVIPLKRAEPEGSIEPMLALTANGMNQVNQVILDRMQ